MRVWGVLAVSLSLSACEQSAEAQDPAIGAAPAPYDFRYAYRLPTLRIKAVQDSHAAGCDRLGPARCRVAAMRYAVVRDGVDAALTLNLDPAIARAFGQAATRTVMAAHGVLIESDIAAAGSHGDTLLAQLRAALAAAETAARGGDAIAAAKASRLRIALSTVAEIDPAAAGSIATTPVVLTYASSASEPSLDAAGPALLGSLSGLAVLLARIGPWLLLLIGGALLLRRIVPPRGVPDEPSLPFAVPRAEPEDRGNVIRRWFHREPENVD